MTGVQTCALPISVKNDQAHDEKKPPAAPEAVTEWTDRRVSERWRDWVALTTTIIAVVTVVTILKVSQYSTLSIVTQGKENNAWSLYQSKSIKAYNCQMAKGALDLQLSGIPGISVEAADKYRAAIKRYDDEIKRYKDEMEELQQQAEGLGRDRDNANKLASGFDNALGFLLSAVILSSIATVMRKKYIWYLSLATLTGWLYFMTITIF